MDRQALDRQALAMRARELSAGLAGRGVRAVALTWVDNAGVTRVKTVPVDRLPEAAAWGVGMSPVFDVFCVDDSITTSRHIGGPVGDLRLHPDLDRLTGLAAQQGWAWAPVDRWTQEGELYPACQRTFARRQAERAAQAGLELRMAYEVEWFIGKPGNDAVPACTGPAYGMTRVIEVSDYVQDLLAALAAEGVVVDQFHPEYATGQLELSVAPADPVGAADLAVLVRQTIRAVAARLGLLVSFAPVVVAWQVGNGADLHRRAQPGELPEAGAAALGRRVPVLGPREPGGGGAVHHWSCRQPRDRGQRRAEMLRWGRQPVPARRGGDRDRHRERRCRPAPAARSDRRSG